MSCLVEVACTWKERGRGQTDSDQNPQAMKLCLDHAIQSLGLRILLTLGILTYDWCYWLFHWITLFLVSTLTCYWDYDKILAWSQSSSKHSTLLHRLALVLGRHVHGEERGLQVEGSGLDAGEILPCVLGHLDRRARLSAGDHVPPHVQLEEEKLIVTSLVIGIPTRVDLTRQKQEAWSLEVTTEVADSSWSFFPSSSVNVGNIDISSGRRRTLGFEEKSHLWGWRGLLLLWSRGEQWVVTGCFLGKSFLKRKNVYLFVFFHSYSSLLVDSREPKLYGMSRVILV